MTVRAAAQQTGHIREPPDRDDGHAVVRLVGKNRAIQRDGLANASAVGQAMRKCGHGIVIPYLVIRADPRCSDGNIGATIVGVDHVDGRGAPAISVTAHDRQNPGFTPAGQGMEHGQCAGIVNIRSDIGVQNDRDSRRSPCHRG